MDPTVDNSTQADRLVQRFIGCVSEIVDGVIHAELLYEGEGGALNFLGLRAFKDAEPFRDADVAYETAEFIYDVRKHRGETYSVISPISLELSKKLKSASRNTDPADLSVFEDFSVTLPKG